VKPKPVIEVDQKDREREVIVRKAVSDLIRAQRKMQNVRLTQEALAYRSGISFEHLNHIENYRATASVEVLDKIARALGFRRLSEFLALDETQIL
jgi:transcriptional regulator with XRE-family HTH domain